MFKKGFAKRFFFPLAFVSITTLLLLLLPPASQSHAQTVTYGPRLGLVTATQATIYWGTSDPEIWELRYYDPVTQQTHTLVDSAPTKFHSQTLTYLSGGTTYTFDVRAGNAMIPGTFTTAPVNKNTPFQFITMADNRADTAKNNKEVGLPQAFLNIIQDAVKRVSHPPAGYTVGFAVNGGDIFATQGIQNGWVDSLYNVFKQATDPLA